MQDHYGEPTNRVALIFVGILLLAGLSIGGWFYFSKADQGTADGQISLNGDTTRLQYRSAETVPTHKPATQSTRPINPITTVPKPRTMTKTASQSSPTSRTRPQQSLAPSASHQSSGSNDNRVRQSHTDFAAREAERFFRDEYNLGSPNPTQRWVDAIPLTTEAVQGWSRYRSTGNVVIEYNDHSGHRKTTRRGYEAFTEATNGQVKLIDFTPKWQTYEP